MLAIKTGATQKSRTAARSHTGAIGGDYAAYLAMCERYGIVNCRSLDDLVECTLAFQCGRLPKGPRIGFVTTSGGTVDLLYDYAETEGAVVPEFSAATNAALMPHMQEGIAPKNPLDVGIPSTLKVAADQCAIVARDRRHRYRRLGFVAAGQGRRLGRRRSASPPVERDRQTGAGVRPHDASGDAGRDSTSRNKAGFPFLQGLEPTLRAINALWFFAQRSGRAPAIVEPAPPSDLTPANLDATLARYGITQPQSRAVASAQEAADAAAAIGFPVALKIRSADIVHKTEAGGVQLNLGSRQDVLAAADALVASAKKSHPDAKIDGFLVQEMVSGVEAIVGAQSDPLYGPLLLIGSGGIMVELMRDAALRLLPAGERDVTAMIEGLKLNQCSPAIAASRRPTARRSKRPRWRSGGSISIIAPKSKRSRSIR